MKGESFMYIPNLVLEVTRNCNLDCQHCLRGCKEQIRFNSKYIDNIFNGVDDIGILTFSGGEPLLCINTIMKVLEYIKENRIGLDSFYIVHNCTIFSKKFMNFLNEYYQYYCNDKSLCGFSLSTDSFHCSEINKKKLNNYYYSYMDLKERGYDFIYDDRKSIYSLIQCGRGKTNSNEILTKYKKNPFFYNGWYSYDSDCYYDNTIYISSNGNIITNCDLSYHIIDKYTFGNIKEEKMIDIFERNMLEDDDCIRIEI